MICICDYDDYNWPVIDPACPVHNQRKTLSERWHTLLDWLHR